MDELTLERLELARDSCYDFDVKRMLKFRESSIVSVLKNAVILNKEALRMELVYALAAIQNTIEMCED